MVPRSEMTCYVLLAILGLGTGHMRRREFIAVVARGAAGWALVAPARAAQGPERIRKIGMLLNFQSQDPEGEVRVKAFVQALQKLGWTDNGNVRIEMRWAGDDADRYRRYSDELVALGSDVILASASPSVAALQRVTHTVPIVFANVIDPVGGGFVNSLARPSGNTTGFTAFEYSISGKWLELLKEFAPDLKRVAVVREPSLPAGIGQFAAIQTIASASSCGVELSAIDPRDAHGIERAFAAFAHQPNGGVIVTAGSSSATHRKLIISLSTLHRLPTVYPFRYFTANGGLASYGPDGNDVYTRVATYVDRILKGERPADLPVQAPTKYELVINLKTAKALGLAVPPTMLARADEVIE
jgi:putative tryptophan/tyrosine transport system substrate-binding protein